VPVTYKDKFRLTLNRAPNWRDSVSGVPDSRTGRFPAGSYVHPAPRPVKLVSSSSYEQLYMPHQTVFELLQEELQAGYTFQRTMSALKRLVPDMSFVWKGGPHPDSRIRVTVIQDGIVSRYRGTVNELKAQRLRFLAPKTHKRESVLPQEVSRKSWKIARCQPRENGVNKTSSHLAKARKRFPVHSPVHASHRDFLRMLLEGWEGKSKVLMSKLHNQALREGWKMEIYRSNDDIWHIRIYDPNTDAKTRFFGPLSQLRLLVAE
jgi:hypothetical protein